MTVIVAGTTTKVALDELALLPAWHGSGGRPDRALLYTALDFNRIVQSNGALLLGWRTLRTGRPRDLDGRNRKRT